jgi:hypothetical protein
MTAGRKNVVWVAGLFVALGAGMATAHGLYEVALAAGVPPVIAWLYPLIIDGLALVAYAATARLVSRGRGYAWTVVVLAAGLSGLGPASYLAGGVETAPPQLRFGVGAWPAIAAAIVAHLVYLLGARDDVSVQPVRSAAIRPTSPSNWTRRRPIAPSNRGRCPTDVRPIRPRWTAPSNRPIPPMNTWSTAIGRPLYRAARPGAGRLPGRWPAPPRAATTPATANFPAPESWPTPQASPEAQPEPS